MKGGQGGSVALDTTGLAAHSDTGAGAAACLGSLHAVVGALHAAAWPCL